MSNPEENSELVKRISEEYVDGKHETLEDALHAALAAADARIAELERWKRLQAEDIMTLGREVGVQIERAETAETLLEEARRALAPFIRLADNVFSDGKNATVADEVTLWCFNDTDITFGDLRRARATLDRIGK